MKIGKTLGMPDFLIYIMLLYFDYNWYVNTDHFYKCYQIFDNL